MIWGTVCCIGDSLTAGARGQLGYPERLVAKLNADKQQTEWACLNHGVCAETTWNILSRTPGAVSQIASQPGAKVCIILAGTNDSKGDGRDLDLWEATYRQILHWPRRAGIPTVLGTLPRVAPPEMPMFTARSSEWLLAASERIRLIAAELHNHPVPLKLVEFADMPIEMLIDGVHARDEGYEWMAEKAAEALLGGFE